ncbi:amidohydrolase family protein [Tahibacter amnicola]|uniref:Amidohydrolase family protein n=1 Tax=Tahibacter amnicola TaxID=2976241 RepID=A0ABY6BGM5_9GAMM|nr:amidohydrolase family protein [Tahibacter amnicola]UXI67017.1 amidohydrolase family protein [Tahibacter amnicola]
MFRLLAVALVASLPLGGIAAENLQYTVIAGGNNVGHVKVALDDRKAVVDFNIKNNGRGPTIAEHITFDKEGLPTEWTITGSTTFGSKVDERFARSGAQASWRDSTGPGKSRPKEPAVYVAQSGSPWSNQIYLRALLKRQDMRMPALPGGTLQLTRGPTLTVQGKAGPREVTRYDLSGIEMTPETLLVDGDGALFAVVSPGMIVVRAGYEAEEVRLRQLAADWATERYVDLQREVAHRYDGPVRIRNVRVFDAHTGALTEPVSVVVHGREIAAVVPIDSPASPGETTIDGAGGTLVPGMHEMHAHVSQEGALLNLLAGVTTMRDMGNDNAVLETLIRRIEAGEIAGPHVVRSGFIEGRSPYNSNHGFVVDSQEKAIDAVRWYAARGFWQVKVYNSMKPEWVPAVVAEAHTLGMRVSGHVPAFTTADKMIEAGYDELTHINQFALGWVIGPEEDTRTLFRLTALKRLPALDLASDKVQHTIGLMAKGNKAIDPTLGIHEALTHNRDGQVPPGAVDYIEHLPIGTRRDMMKGWVDVSAKGDDEAYRSAFDKLVAVVKQLHERGVFIVFGTDTGGSFSYHRELELYQKAGMSAPQILKRATLETARYLGEDQRRGSITKGKLASFFLVPGDPTQDLKAIKRIAVVVKDGVFYYPAEVYPKFGITPFVDAPTVVEAASGGKVN